MTYHDLLTDDLLLTDAGLETVLVFHEGLELPHFAAFPLLDDEEGRATLRRYYEPFLALAAERGAGFVLETPTWRANSDWGARLGYSPIDLHRVNADAVALARELALAWVGSGRVLISGAVGPRGDGYVPGAMMTSEEAAAYHRPQIRTFAEAGVDLVTALTLSYVEEAVGVVAAAAEAGIPSVVGFTVETDGRLPSGTTLGEAIGQVDAATGSAAAWFAVNCAHPEHIAHGFPAEDEPWQSRIGALRANASRQSHAELDEAEVLDDGDPADLARGYVDLGARLPAVRVLGGCCGTDVRHVSALAGAWGR